MLFLAFSDKLELRFYCLWEELVRKDRLRHKILPGILDSKSWA